MDPGGPFQHGAGGTDNSRPGCERDVATAGSPTTPPARLLPGIVMSPTSGTSMLDARPTSAPSRSRVVCGLQSTDRGHRHTRRWSVIAVTVTGCGVAPSVNVLGS